MAPPDGPAEPLVSDADHLQLARLVTEVAWRIGHGRAETVHELFVDDAEMTMGPTTLSGREEIRQWGRKLVDDRTYPGIRHVCMNMRFVADGDGGAAGITVNTVYLDGGGGSDTTLPWTVGEDHDRFVRTDQGWRFVSRYWNELFARQAA